MRVVRHADPAAFLAAAESFLAAREALHNIPMSIARTCCADTTRYPGPNYWASVEDGARVVGVAAMTPPHRLQIYVPPGEAIDAVAEDLASSAWTLPGVHGPADAASAFAASWSAHRGTRADVRMDLRAFELRRVIAAPPVRGAMRRAETADLELVASWYRAFEVEAHAGPSSADVARRAIADGRHVLWLDDRPVAQAAIVGTTPNGARIGAVYTPPELRRRGYATALVAALSQRVLDEGRTFAFLFTDLANPVSNSIYPKVGYRAIGDFRDYDFVR
jgi:predicted GNAT family acetyltransferase